MNESDDKEYPVPTIAESMSTLRRIVETRSIDRLPGGLECDLFSASAIVGVYDALSDEARAKFDGLDLLKGQTIALKLIERSQE